MNELEKVCAVIVTYNCTEFILDNIDSLKNQVDHIVVVDNASNKVSRKILADMPSDCSITIINNEHNMGLGYALNQGLEFAKLNNFKFILTMDQDSVLCENAVFNMIAVLNRDSTVGSVGPNYEFDKSMCDESHYYKVQYLITSGNLSYVDSIILAGGFNADLFIDSIDFDFSLALQDKGQQLAKVQNAYMRHKIGENEQAKFIFKTFTILSHSPVRYYYMYRNHVYIMKKYFLKNPTFCIKKQIFATIDLLQVIFVQNQSKEKISMILKGVKDGFKNRLGPIS